MDLTNDEVRRIFQALCFESDRAQGLVPRWFTQAEADEVTDLRDRFARECNRREEGVAGYRREALTRLALAQMADTFVVVTDNGIYETEREDVARALEDIYAPEVATP